MIVGFKLWYADGSKHVVGVFGREHDQVQADVDALPATGLQCVMVYFDEFSTITCRACRARHIADRQREHPTPHPDGNQPFTPGRACRHCGQVVEDDTGTRYRRMVQGNDHYFIVYDTQPPPPLRDWLIGQTNAQTDVEKYPSAKYIAGGFVTDTAYKVYVEQAMADMDVREFGMQPVPGTSD